jgi:uncharacterized protein
MELTGEAKLLRIFLGERDKWKHKPLYEVIVTMAKQQGLAGATGFRGILSFKILELSQDLPILVEIVDSEDKVNAFLPALHNLFEEAGSGGLVTMEKVQIIKVTSKNSFSVVCHRCRGD